MRGGMGTIFFVDDHHAFRTVFAEILRLKGYTVFEAATPDDVHRLLERHSGSLDLLLIEAVLTTTNGVAVARQLSSRYPAVGVLYISEERASDLIVHRELPVDAPFLQKPFDAETLYGKVEEFLGCAL